MTSQIGGQTRLFANFDIRQAPEQAKGIRVHDTLIGRIFYSLFSTTVRVNLEGGKSVVVNKNSLTKYLNENKICSETEANALSKEDIRKLVGNCFSRTSTAPAGEKKEQMVAEFRNIFRNTVKPESGKVRMAAEEEGVLPSVFLRTQDLKKLGDQLTRQLDTSVAFDVIPQGQMMLKALGHDIPISHSWTNPQRPREATFEISPQMLHALASTFVDKESQAASQKAGELSQSRDPDDRLIGQLLRQCIQEKEHPDAEIAEGLAAAQQQPEPSAPLTASSGGPQPTEVSDEKALARLSTALVASDDNTGAFEGGVRIDRRHEPNLRAAFFMAGIKPDIAQMFINRRGPEQPISFTFGELVLLRELAQRAQSSMQQSIVRADPEARREMPALTGASVGLPPLPPAPKSPPKAPVVEERAPSPRPSSPHVPTPPGTPPRAQTPPRTLTPPRTPAAEAHAAEGMEGAGEAEEALTADSIYDVITAEGFKGLGSAARTSFTTYQEESSLFQKDPKELSAQDYAMTIRYCRSAASSLKAGPTTIGGQTNVFLRGLPPEQKAIFSGLLDKIYEENARTHHWITDMRKCL